MKQTSLSKQKSIFPLSVATCHTLNTVRDLPSKTKLNLIGFTRPYYAKSYSKNYR